MRAWRLSGPAALPRRTRRSEADGARVTPARRRRPGGGRRSPPAIVVRPDLARRGARRLRGLLAAAGCAAASPRRSDPTGRDVARVRDRLELEGKLLETLAHPHLPRAFETVHEPHPVVIIETLVGLDAGRADRGAHAGSPRPISRTSAGSSRRPPSTCTRWLPPPRHPARQRDGARGHRHPDRPEHRPPGRGCAAGDGHARVPRAGAGGGRTGDARDRRVGVGRDAVRRRDRRASPPESCVPCGCCARGWTPCSPTSWTRACRRGGYRPGTSRSTSGGLSPRLRCRTRRSAAGGAARPAGPRRPARSRGRQRPSARGAAASRPRPRRSLPADLADPGHHLPCLSTPPEPPPRPARAGTPP